MSTPAPKPVAKAPEPKPKPAAPVAAKPKTENPETTESSDDKNLRRAIWIGASVAAVAVAIGIPLLCKMCGGDGGEEEEEKKVASSGAVLNKLVSWVKEITDGEQEQEQELEEAEKKDDKYIEISSVVDFAKTQSM